METLAKCDRSLKRGSKALDQENADGRKRRKNIPNDDPLDEIDPESVSVGGMDYIKFEDLKPPKNAHVCWGCKYEFCPTEHTGDPTPDQIVYEEYQNNKRTMDPDELSVFISDLHYNLIYIPQTEAGFPTFYWPKEIVYAHFMDHNKDMELILKECLSDNLTMRKHLKDSLFFGGPRNRADPSNANLKTLAELDKGLQSIMKQVTEFQSH